MQWISNLLGLKPSEQEFVEIARAAIKERTGRADLNYDRQNFSLAQSVPNGRALTYYLKNAYADYCAAGANGRKGVLDAYFCPTVHDVSLEEARPHILARVQSRAFYSETQLQLQLAQLQATNAITTQFPSKPFSQHLAIGLIHDTPRMVNHINGTILDGWKITADELWDLSMQNLKAATTKPFNEVSPGIFMPRFGDGHDATRILLRDRVAACRVKGRCVALAANPDSLVITGEDDANGLSFMLKVAQDASQRAHLMPLIPLVFADGKWTEWELPPDHGLAKDFAYWRAFALSGIYNTQKDLLGRLYEAKGTELFIATYSAMRAANTGDVVVNASWTEGVPTALPEADLICFVRIENNSGNVICTAPWNDVRTIVGDMMTPMGLYPERYQVTSFPSDQQLEELKKAEPAMMAKRRS